ncbi:hypothetical protein KPL70_018511 [Citrus sinensis]|uniref:uncharacterized protein LOC107177509 n=1 Tax=Citrus sinensis TaxID=2711 RepID=UPI0007638344|nr:uncharacterized protein LOC107177509 [Citrus sinensis]KAH9674589.1 hypothetical protein KPL70_018511 [Citrus sinensis]GAY33119.1 hypothetical protein CUMW_005710 [Citrus unshiu]
MGNCLMLEEKLIKVMKTDGKILEYKAPVKVQDVLAEFAGHAISDSFPEIRHLMPDFKLLGGNLYFLVPVPLPSRKVEKKKVRFSEEEARDGAKETSSVVRMKVVIRKQELQDLLLLQKGGVVSVQDVGSWLQGKQSTNSQAVGFQDGGNNNEGWKPELESIPEVD